MSPGSVGYARWWRRLLPPPLPSHRTTMNTRKLTGLSLRSTRRVFHQTLRYHPQFPLDWKPCCFIAHHPHDRDSHASRPSICQPLQAVSRLGGGKYDVGGILKPSCATQRIPCSCLTHVKWKALWPSPRSYPSAALIDTGQSQATCRRRRLQGRFRRHQVGRHLYEICDA
jgi:hypothetical protein